MSDGSTHAGPTRPGSDGGSGDRSAQVAVRHALTSSELEQCFEVIVHLRPQLASATEWRERACGMQAAGYRVLACWCHGAAQAVAGYRVSENLIHGRFLYVDDLVTKPEQRGRRMGARLMDCLTRIAEDEQCTRLVLDASARNTDARRFYERAGLHALIVGYVQTIERKPSKP